MYQWGNFMNRLMRPLEIIKIGMVIGFLATSAGCASFGAGSYGGAVIVAEPDEYLFGGDYERGHDVRHFSHRGSQSRASVHSGAMHSGARQGGRR